MLATPLARHILTKGTMTEGMKSMRGTTGLASSPDTTKPICLRRARK